LVRRLFLISNLKHAIFSLWNRKNTVKAGFLSEFIKIRMAFHAMAMGADDE